MCSDRKQKFRTQYLEQDATPCAVSDALHYLATTRPFLRNFLIYEETYSQIVHPDWSTMTTHTHPSRAEVYKVWRCIATAQYAMMLSPSSSSSGWGTDSSRHCLSILLNGPRKNIIKVMILRFRAQILSLYLQNIPCRSQLHSVGNSAPTAIQWQIILHHNVIGFHSNALQWMDPIYKSHVSLKTKQLSAGDQHHIETCYNLIGLLRADDYLCNPVGVTNTDSTFLTVISLNDDHPLPGIMII
jgi:hypothetical protein